MKTIQEDAANADQYKDSKEEIAKASNTLAVIVLALGLHDEDNKYKAAAPAILKAAQEVAAAANFDAAKKAAEKLEAAAGSGKAEGDMKWTKVASLEQLMKQVPLVNTKLKRNVKGARLKSKAKETAGLSAVIAVIAQGSLANTEEAKATTPELVDQWRKFSKRVAGCGGGCQCGHSRRQPKGHGQGDGQIGRKLRRLPQRFPQGSGKGEGKGGVVWPPRLACPTVIFALLDKPAVALSAKANNP